MFRSPIQRALELARSGRFATLSEVAIELRREGFQQVESHLHGRATRAQLREMIKAAQ